MRYSDLAGKEIIDIDQGVRLGVLSDTDLVIDARSGKLKAIVIPYRGGLMNRRDLVIPWHGIRKIGVDLIIVDLSTASERPRGWSPDQEPQPTRSTTHPSFYGDIPEESH